MQPPHPEWSRQRVANGRVHPRAGGHTNEGPRNSRGLAFLRESVDGERTARRPVWPPGDSPRHESHRQDTIAEHTGARAVVVRRGARDGWGREMRTVGGRARTAGGCRTRHSAERDEEGEQHGGQPWRVTSRCPSRHRRRRRAWTCSMNRRWPLRPRKSVIGVRVVQGRTNAVGSVAITSHRPRQQYARQQFVESIRQEDRPDEAEGRAVADVRRVR